MRYTLAAAFIEISSPDIKVMTGCQTCKAEDLPESIWATSAVKCYS